MHKHLQMRKLLLITLLTVATSGCGHLTVYDGRITQDLGDAGGHYHNLYTPATGDIDKATWDKERVGQICMDSGVFTDIETTIDTACTKLTCDYKTRQVLAHIMENLRPFLSQVETFRKIHLGTIINVQ